MFGRLTAVAGLSNSRSSTATTLSLPITQSLPRDAAGLCRGQLGSDLHRVAQPALTSSSSTSGLIAA